GQLVLGRVAPEVLVHGPTPSCLGRPWQRTQPERRPMIACLSSRPARPPTRGEAMDHRKLGSAEISIVGFGAWEAGGDMWGPNESDEIVLQAIRAAVEAGMSWIDTAEVYGSGRSEQLVGKAVAGRRDEV